MDEGFTIVLPEEHQRAAEEVRAHLVAIRGGAPFLSSADARLLVGWLETGVSVVAILSAIEHEAKLRRKKPTRRTFTLGRVKTHLVRQNAPLSQMPADDSIFEPVAATVRQRGAEFLATSLLALNGDSADTLVRDALRIAREFLVSAWEGMDDAERRRRHQLARDLLVQLDLGYDEADLDLAAEELAREDFRAEWPMLDAERFWALATGKK